MEFVTRVRDDRISKLPYSINRFRFGPLGWRFSESIRLRYFLGAPIIQILQEGDLRDNRHVIPEARLWKQYSELLRKLRPDLRRAFIAQFSDKRSDSAFHINDYYNESTQKFHGSFGMLDLITPSSYAIINYGISPKISSDLLCSEKISGIISELTRFK